MTMKGKEVMIHFTGRTPPEPTSKRLKRAQVDLEKETSRSRLRALETFSSAIETDPADVKYATKGLWACLFDNDPDILKKACSIINGSASNYPSLFNDFINPLVYLVHISPTEGFQEVSRCLLTISGTSGKNGKRTLTELIRNYTKNLNW